MVPRAGTPHRGGDSGVRGSGAARGAADDLGAYAEARLADGQVVVDWARRHVNLGAKNGRLLLQAVKEAMAIDKQILAAAQVRQAFEAAKASVTAPGVRASLDRKLDALAERLKKIRGRTLNGGRSTPATPEGPNPTGPVH